MSPPIVLPTGNIIATPRPYSPELLEQAIGKLCASQRSFTGFISITSDESLYLLFFFNSHLYAAGKSIGDKPFSPSLHEFFLETGLIKTAGATIAIHGTDPVLLKCLLVFFQKDPTAKAPSNLIDLEAILGQIQQNGSDALIILEKNQMFNFFFFKDGTRGKSYFSDTEFSEGLDLPIDEQVLVYAFQGGDASVDALVYRSVITSESTDSALIDQKEMLQLLRGNSSGKKTGGSTEVSVEDNVKSGLILYVLEGPQKGQTLTGPIPCILGRKDTDIIVADSAISKRHAAIQLVKGELTIMDLNSTNGTTVNGNEIQQQTLSNGDIISMGSTTLKVLQITLP